MMTVADKLTKIAANEKKVYEAGHDAGYTEGLNKGGYADGFEEGKKAEHDAFWDAYQQNGARTQYNGAFYGYGWNDDNFKPKYDIAPVGYGCSSTFFQCRVTDLVAALDRQGVKLNFSKVQSLSSAFQASCITKIPPLDLSSALTCGNAFFNCYDLKAITLDNIKEVCDFAKTFANCTELTDVTLSGTVGQNIDFQYSTKLSADSIRSIITHLSDAEPPAGQPKKTLTLSRTAVENADFGGGDNVYVSTVGTTKGAYVYFNPISLKAGDKIKFSIVVADGHHYNDYDWEHPSDWYVGMNPYSGEPTYTDEIYTAQNDEQLNYLTAYVITPSAMTVSFKLRAVLIDDNGNEITGENLAIPITGDFTANDFDYSNVEYTVSDESWETLQASKPNWNISLV